jgi:outer membrane protein OmpA-like peptidoglycan-associated protein
MGHPSFRLAALSLIALLAWADPAHALLGATSDFQENPLLNVQVFRPSPHRGDIGNVARAGVAGHLKWTGGVVFSVGRNPFVFCKPDRENADGSITTGCQVERQEVVQNQTVLDVMGSIGLFDWLDVGISIPVFISNTGETNKFAEPVQPVSSSTLGDIRLSMKSRSWGFGAGPFEAKVGANVLMGLPTGNAASFVSDGLQIAALGLADLSLGPWSILGNVGVNVRTATSSALVDKDSLGSTQHVEYLRLGSGVVWRAGTALSILGEDKALAEVAGFELAAVGEVYGLSSNLLGDEDVGEDNTFSAVNANNVEGTIGARVGLPDLGLTVQVGGGSGLSKGYGSTKYRVYASVAYAQPENRDKDRDGIMDDVDACPTEPEDVDDFEDDDGCPEADNDGDEIPDAADRCPNDPEDKDGFRDKDGCPEPDNDGDDILDADDKCPQEAEDKDKFQDEDGCPDADNDGDEIPDSADNCPDEAETRNGHQDTDGCPDESLAKFDANAARIVILDNVYFAFGQETIKPQSFPVLKAVAGLLHANPNIKKVRIEGHTDDKGGPKRNKTLSQKRADAVRNFLVQEGIGTERLEPVGFGKERPIAEGNNKAAASANRRVEFVITE